MIAAGTRCSVCHTRIDDADQRAVCPSCQQEMHAACATELGGCGTYGCARAARAEKPAPREIAAAGWGDEKTCPACAVTLASTRLVCTCGARFPWADPMTRAEYAAWRAERRGVDRVKAVIAVLFFLTLAGLPAPITGPAGGVVAWMRRDALLGANGTWLAVAAGSAVLGGARLVLLVVLGLAS